MHAAAFMMDDDMETAEAELSKGNSVFHKHGKGVVSFLGATLGFEREVMKEAQERLTDAETAASEQHSRALRNPSASASTIYSAGTEFALVLAEVRLMGAIIGVLTESVTEAIRGFYKLRQAYLALDAIQQEEKKYLESNRLQDRNYDTSSDSQTSSVQDLTQSGPSTDASSTVADEDGDDFVDADETHVDKETSKYMGRLSTDEDPTDEMDKMTIKDDLKKPTALRKLSSAFPEGPGMDIFGDNVVDAFIHSGANMCYGMILIMLSMLYEH